MHGGTMHQRKVRSVGRTVRKLLPGGFVSSATANNENPRRQSVHFDTRLSASPPRVAGTMWSGLHTPALSARGLTGAATNKALTEGLATDTKLPTWPMN